MADQNLSSSVQTRIRSRLIFSGTVTPIGGYSRRHHSHEATIGYRSLCLRGFVVQGSLEPRNRLLDDVFRIIDNIGWSYTVLHVHPFCPRVRNWLRGPESDLMIKKHLRLLYVVAKRKEIDFEVPLLPGDEEPIGRGLPIYGLGSDGSGPRGRRRLC
ncbi:hypothetical protein DY000_02013661 [Brassica cretica]|uniref:Uncharacterized protein n=1 Tax=Brassica cretica TaxID=69181 RepID=A0ABQ7DE76_BRACR|nr:hypothetical protein DY000_02013661 [Brassica cretica]